MGFTKLCNLKAGVAAPPPEGVSVSCRELKATKRKTGAGSHGPTRFAVIRVGAVIARKAGWNGQARADVVVGDGLERRRCGIAVADRTGQFKLRKLLSGDYQLTVPERAGGGMLVFDAPRFTAPAELVPIVDGSPPAVMFDLSKEMRAP